MCHSLLRPVTFALPSHFFCPVLGTEETMLKIEDIEAIQDEEGVHLALVVPHCHYKVPILNCTNFTIIKTFTTQLLS